MKHFASRFIVVVLICLTFAGASSAQMDERDMAKEEKIRQQLKQTAPKAVEIFKAATVALDDGKYQESAELYNQVLSQSPTCEAAMRRLSFALVGMGKRGEGLKASQTALDFNRTPDNLIGLAINLTSSGANNYQPTKTELEEAFALSKEAMQKDTENDSDYPVMVAQLALATNRMEDFRDVSQKLNAKFPDSPATHYFNGIRLADAGDLDAAEAEVVKAQNLGMPSAATQELLKAIQTEKDNNY